MGDVLAHGGWQVDLREAMVAEELAALVSTTPVVAVGLSVSCSAFVPLLGRAVRAIRETSLNKDIVVMLGSSLDLKSYAEDAGAVYCASAHGALTCLQTRARLAL